MRELRELRQRRGLTQQELSRRAGVTQDAISKIERGERKPHASTLKRLRSVLGGEDYERASQRPRVKFKVNNVGYLCGFEMNDEPTAIVAATIEMRAWDPTLVTLEFVPNVNAEEPIEFKGVLVSEDEYEEMQERSMARLEE